MCFGYSLLLDVLSRSRLSPKKVPKHGEVPKQGEHYDVHSEPVS